MRIGNIVLIVENLVKRMTVIINSVSSMEESKLLKDNIVYRTTDVRCVEGYEYPEEWEYDNEEEVEL